MSEDPNFVFGQQVGLVGPNPLFLRAVIEEGGVFDGLPAGLNQGVDYAESDPSAAPAFGVPGM